MTCAHRSNNIEAPFGRQPTTLPGATTLAEQADNIALGARKRVSP
jgi:hypothetical protein